MGGNALKEIETRRVQRDEYFEIKDEVLFKLRTFNSVHKNTTSIYPPDRRFTDILAYSSKSDFGDLDILIETFDDDVLDWKEVIEFLFEPKQIVRNPIKTYTEGERADPNRKSKEGVISFDVRGFQVDFILTPTEYFQTSIDYYNWNDLGNLCGRIYKKMGFKYGHKGMSYLFRDENNVFNVYDEQVICHDQRIILEFADLNYDEFCQGFDTLEDAFLWLTRSKYFHPDIFLLENRNYKSRVRDEKRRVYNYFLKWCAEQTGLNQYHWPEMKEQLGYAGNTEFLRLALKTIPGFAALHCKVVFLYEQKLRVQEKFNGQVVHTLTGLTGKSLSLFMKYMLDKRGGKKEAQKKWFHDVQETIEADIKSDYAEWILNCTVHKDCVDQLTGAPHEALDRQTN